MRLIDADALLQKFNDTGIQITFDLPVEEILGEDVDIDDFTMLVQDAVQVYRKMVIGTIQEQPTAYDTEKVVAKLEEMLELTRKAQTIECRINDGYGTPLQAKYSGEIGALLNAIEIVRRGGVE